MPDLATARAYTAIEREEVRWLWPGRVPLGMLTLLLGDPGLGKSLFTCWLAAKASRAGGNVLMLSAEDSPGATIRPRLEAVNADLSRVHDVALDREGVAEGLALPDDVPALDQLVAEHYARLAVIDPLAAHLADGVNSWRDQSVRRALAPLARMAAEHSCAVVVVAHLNKGKGGDALYRAGGSIGVPAAARSALLLARDPQDPDGERGSQRVIAHVKSNVSEQAESLACRVTPILLDDDEQAKTARIEVTGTSGVTAAELLAAPDTEQRTERDEATEFLLAELADGPQDAKRLYRDAPCSERTLRSAKQTLNIEAYRESTGNAGAGRWLWRMSGNTATGNTATPISAALPPCENPHNQADPKTARSQDGNTATPRATPATLNGHKEDSIAERVAAIGRMTDPAEAERAWCALQHEQQAVDR